MKKYDKNVYLQKKNCKSSSHYLITLYSYIFYSKNIEILL